MSYLDDAVVDLSTELENGALYVVVETDVVDGLKLYNAHEYAERKYRRDNAYNGYLHSVVQECDDGYEVMVAEQSG